MRGQFWRGLSAPRSQAISPREFYRQDETEERQDG